MTGHSLSTVGRPGLPSANPILPLILLAIFVLVTVLVPVLAVAGNWRTSDTSPAVAALYQKLSTNPQKAQTWRKLGLQLRAEGQLRAALGPLKQALNLDQAAGNRPHIAIGHNEIGHLYRALARQGAGTDPAVSARHRGRAMDAFAQAADLQRAIGNPLALGLNLRALARLQQWGGQHARAAQTFDRAAAAFQDARRVRLAAETRAEARAAAGS